jgi:hypothetical protein
MTASSLGGDEAPEEFMTQLIAAMLIFCFGLLAFLLLSIVVFGFALLFFGRKSRRERSTIKE